MESSGQEQHFPNKHISPRNYYRIRAHLTYIMNTLYNGLITYSILLCSTKQDKHFLFSHPLFFYPHLRKILLICPWVMFNSRIHFRTNTFDILSHLADRETTDGRYIHVRLLTYFHIILAFVTCHQLT